MLNMSIMKKIKSCISKRIKNSAKGNYFKIYEMANSNLNWTSNYSGKVVMFPGAEYFVIRYIKQKYKTRASKKYGSQAHIKEGNTE